MKKEYGKLLISQTLRLNVRNCHIFQCVTSQFFYYDRLSEIDMVNLTLLLQRFDESNLLADKHALTFDC